VLEQPDLWLGPWSAAASAAAAPAGTALVISEPESRRPLGMARWRPRPGPFWRRWFTPAVLEVVESADESLLCTVQRSWRLRPCWEVLDADGRYVGSIQGPYVLDPFGRPLALFLSARTGLMKSFVDASSCEVGTLEQQPGGNRLSFGMALPDNPFARMLLLAFVLVS